MTRQRAVDLFEPVGALASVLVMADLLAAAAANATTVRSAEVAARTLSAAQRAAEADLDDASTIVLHACQAPAGMVVPVLKAPSNSTRPNASRSGEVSPVWLYFEKLPATTDEDGNELTQVKCLCKRTLANGSRRVCGVLLNYKSSQGTKNMFR